MSEHIDNLRQIADQRKRGGAVRVTTGPHDIGPHDFPHDARGRRAWDFVCYAATDCKDKAAAIELALDSADQTLIEEASLHRRIKRLEETIGQWQEKWQVTANVASRRSDRIATLEAALAARSESEVKT